MTAEPQHHENEPPEPLVEERGDGPSPTIDQAGDDVADMVVGDRRDRPIVADEIARPSPSA